MIHRLHFVSVLSRPHILDLSASVDRGRILPSAVGGRIMLPAAVQKRMTQGLSPGIGVC